MMKSSSNNSFISLSSIETSMPKKGEFPARPPTFAEAIQGSAELGTAPENAESILKDLNLDALKPKAGAKPKTKKEDNKEEVKKQSIHQMDAHLSEPLSADKPSSIDQNWITPNLAEAVVNLQMDYLLQRKAQFVKAFLRSRLLGSVVTGVMSMIAYHKLNGYMTEYNLRNGYVSAAFELFSNSYFMDDFTMVMFSIVFILGSTFVFVKFQSGFLQFESDEVPQNMEKYFDTDLIKYSTIKNWHKPSKKEDKELVKYMKENSVVIIYRETPVAFLMKKPIENESNTYEITGLGIRRVYVKAELLKDLLGLTFKKFLEEKEDIKLRVQLYSFENFDISIFQKAGFVKTKSEKFNWIVSNLFNLTRDTYEFEMNSIEF